MAKRQRRDSALTRTEHDSMGDVEVPADALYAAQTQRAVDNFPLSGLVMPERFIHALAMIKRAAATSNAELGLLDAHIAGAIADAASSVEQGMHDDQFPVDVFQTGSGTSSNMNMNEVLAHLASRSLEAAVHPNDQVNLGQSSNDVIPTALHLSASIALHSELLPALDHLHATIERRAAALGDQVKTGRTHLMDAMPLRLDQELGAWAGQISDARTRLQQSGERLLRLAIGGTAVGTGINAHPDFAALVVRRLAAWTGLALVPSDNRFRDLSSQDTAVEISGQLNALATALMKISNDLRWMNSGPLAGLGEIQLPALQPGSSIMPGKVNPVIPEAVCMACAQVMGHHTSITIAGQAGNFQLNVMLPLIAYDLLQSIQLLTNGARVLADSAIAGFVVDTERVNQALSRNPILVTALNAVIGYEQGANIAKLAYAQKRPLIDVARDVTGLGEEELQRLLDPMRLTQGGLPD